MSDLATAADDGTLYAPAGGTFGYGAQSEEYRALIREVLTDLNTRLREAANDPQNQFRRAAGDLLRELDPDDLDSGSLRIYLVDQRTPQGRQASRYAGKDPAKGFFDANETLLASARDRKFLIA
jgi:hypothetical protein